MAHLFWVGPRQSDIRHLSGIFDGAVTIFGNHDGNRWFSFEGCHGWRPNHNATRNRHPIWAFYATQLSELAAKGVHFLCYGSEWQHCADRSAALYCNDLALIHKVSNKMSTRLLFADSMKVVPSLWLSREECSLAALVQRFPNASSYVLQSPVGSGGAGTWLIENENDCALARQSLTNDVVASRYIPGVPLNQHVIVTDEGGVPLPPSIQIIEVSAGRQLLYRGGDYAAALDLPAGIRRTLDEQSVIIAECLGQLGYRGVAGIDYILNGDQAFLVEINPRFQASSPTLNASLEKVGQASLQHMHMAAFEHRRIVRPQVSCHESFYIYSASRFDYLPSLPSELCLEIEGGNDDLPPKIDPGAPTYRLRGSTALAASFHGLSRVSPAVRDLLAPAPRLSRLCDGNIEDMARLKCMLLAYGVQATPNTNARIGSLAYSQAPPGTYNNGLELRLNGAYITARPPRPVGLSPFSVDYRPNAEGFTLEAGSESVPVDVILPPTAFLEARTTSGRLMTEVGQFFTDRLRLYPYRGCKFTGERACKFCEVPTLFQAQEKNELQDIRDTVNFCMQCKDLSFHHVLVSGGVVPDLAGWQHLVTVVTEIRSICDLPIYLMVVPPPDRILEELLDAGVDEIGFNIEVFDQAIAAALMPGKGRISRQRYFEVMDRAVNRLGRGGAVRSVLIPGLEPISSTLQGIEALASRGIMPILSPFTPVAGSALSGFHSLCPEELFEIWRAGQKLCERHGLGLGPQCIACQNNTLALPTSSFYRNY